MTIAKNIFRLIVIAVLIFQGCHPQPDKFQASIVDSGSGNKVPARVYISSIEGVRIEPDGEHEHVDYLSKKWCYSDGTFSVSAPHRDMIVEIRRGLETRPVKDTVRFGDDGPVVFRLERWTDMIRNGYVSGDIHGHYLLLDGAGFMKEAMLQMKAEDLPVQAILAFEGNTVTPHFTGKPDTVSNKEFTIYVGQEVRDWQMGHLSLIGLSRLVEGYPIVGGKLESMDQPHWLMYNAMLEVRRQGGIIAWSHFSNLPGAESPIAIALGMIDALELMTFNEPTDLPSHWGPWNNSGMSMAEFPVLRGMDLYYQYLNAGFNLPIVAGTDKMKNDIPIGSNRYYARYSGGDRYDSWTNGIKKGNGFITNGPLLDFTVDNQEAGDHINFTGTRKVNARVTARSILPFATLEIVRNGAVVGHKTVFANNNPPVNGVYTMQLDTIVELNESSWIAARVADDPDNRNRILPRGLSVFAHTNPIYFNLEGKPVKVKASIAYLEKYVQGVIHWLEKNPPFKNPEDRIMALQLARKALAIYRHR